MRTELVETRSRPLLHLPTLTCCDSSAFAAWLAAQLLDCDVMAAETLTELIKDNSDMVDEL